MSAKVEREWDDDVCIACSVHNRCAEFEEKKKCSINSDTGEMNDYSFLFLLFATAHAHQRSGVLSHPPLIRLVRTWKVSSAYCASASLFRAVGTEFGGEMRFGLLKRKPWATKIERGPVVWFLTRVRFDQLAFFSSNISLKTSEGNWINDKRDGFGRVLTGTHTINQYLSRI